MFGNFKHHITNPECSLLKGFGDVFHCQHSRHTEVRHEDIIKHRELIIDAESYEAGVHVVSDSSERQFFLFGHWEYDRETLSKEYFRDKNKGLDIQVPYNYYPDNDPSQIPIFNWSCSANLMYANWLNYCVYQKTPYNLNELEIRSWTWETQF
jgi:homoserine O-succinyltransferase